MFLVMMEEVNEVKAMIELKFYRDDEYVYINNPDGTTKRVPIEDFENTFNVDTAELPAYTSSDAGKVLAVNSGGTGVEWDESQSIDYLYPITVIYNEQSTSYTVDKTYAEILSAMDSGKFCIGVGDITPYLVGRYFYSGNTYIQFFDFNLVLPGTESQTIAMSGFRLAPDGTITSFYKTAD